MTHQLLDALDRPAPAIPLHIAHGVPALVTAAVATGAVFSEFGALV